MLIVLGYASSADANFVIRLKNGNEYVTAHYRQEGRQLLFEAYGGVFGVDNSFIAKVEKSSSARLTQSGNQSPTISAPGPAKKEIAESSATPKPKTQDERLPDDPITTEFNQLKARAKNVNYLLTSEIRQLLKEITAFRNRLTKDSKLFINYGREFNDAREIADVVETALTARTQ
jgi:hypothetical protein